MDKYSVTRCYVFKYPQHHHHLENTLTPQTLQRKIRTEVWCMKDGGKKGKGAGMGGSEAVSAWGTGGA